MTLIRVALQDFHSIIEKGALWLNELAMFWVKLSDTGFFTA